VFSIRRTRTKLAYPAGSESGVGAFVNEFCPERAVAALRAGRL
jgi:galactose-1-phosphate uridylyltransferase